MEKHAGAARAPWPDESAPVVGRDAELARLHRTVDGAPGADRVLVLLGDAGAGKTTLLDRAALRAAEGGARVLRAAGSASESPLAFSALHQLLRPVLAEADALPERQRAALHGALGEGPADPDPLLVGVAVLGLLSSLGGRGRVLVVLDDAQWCDRASLDALSFAARRLAGEPVAVLVAARAGAPVPGFGRGLPVLDVGPLDGAAAGRLLDAQPQPPAGRTRARILDEAGGNPLALAELARAAAAPGAAPPPPAGPLPLTDHLERLFAARLDGLPDATGRALLLLAAMDTADTALAVLAGLPQAGDEAWPPAERAGLVRRTGADVRFRHPLARSAVYHAAPFDARRAAHLALAGALRDEPDRRAWHLAAACPGPDAAVSAELERTADRARRRGGHAAAAAALQRAAELAPGREDGARLLVEAADAAVLTGDLAWVEELTAAVRARTDDASLLAAAAARAGRLAVLTSRHTAVLDRLAAAAEQSAAERPAAALDLLTGAAVASYYCGEEAGRRRVLDALRLVPDEPPLAWGRAWVRAVADPGGDRAGLVRLLHGAAADPRPRPERLTSLAIMAWLLDETPLAVRAFDRALDRWEALGPLPEGLGGAAAWAYVEQGRWGRARELCARAAAVGSAAGLDHAVACAAAVDATVLAFQGDAAAARARARDTLALVDPLESRSVAVHARRALGAAAAAEGAYQAAYDRLRAVFTADGDPVHYHASYPALADLAAAAVRCGRREEAAAVVERSAQVLGDAAPPRLLALLARARGLLADPADAEPHFRAALADPVLEHWPFERAQTLLDHAEWLRRRRRVVEARPLLAEALEVFRRLGARPWIERARAESRAAGLDVADTPPDALAALSPQQQQIIRLAARGLTNRAIGERLFLSPRTVGSHLYRSFPKLGVTARSQLRDLVEDTGAPAARRN